MIAQAIRAILLASAIAATLVGPAEAKAAGDPQVQIGGQYKPVPAV
jgi:hypothetical protein